MRSLFLLLLGGTVGAIAGVLIITFDPSFGGSSNGSGVGIGRAGAWMTESAIATLLERELTDPELEGPGVAAIVDIREDGLMYLSFVSTQPAIPLTLVLDPGVLDGSFHIEVVEQEGGNPVMAGRIARIIVDEVDALIRPEGGKLVYVLTAITTTDRRLTLEVDIAQ